jgi:hypothetical protein
MTVDHEPKVGKTEEQIQAELAWIQKNPNLNIAWLKSRGLFVDTVGVNSQGLHERAAAQIDEEHWNDDHSPESQMGL